jgi:hypothetical protein
MTLLLCLLLIGLEMQQADEPVQLLEQAQRLYEQISRAAVEGRELRSDARSLLPLCVKLRQGAPTNVVQCMNEGNAASLVGDWPHALLAYRLAQRLAPYDVEIAARLSVVRERLVVPDQSVGPRQEIAAVLGANSRLRASLWLIALLLYVLAWIRIGGPGSGISSSGIMPASLGIMAALGLAALLCWADANRRAQLSQMLGVIKRGNPIAVREGNGLSYPLAAKEHLRAGAELIILGRRGDWLHVRTNRGLTGWVPSSSVDVE